MLASPMAAASSQLLSFTMSSKTSSSSTFFLLIRYPSSTKVISTRSAICGSHVSLYLVVLTLPARFSSPVRAVTSPAASLVTVRMMQLPQSISVTSSLGWSSVASAWSSHTWLHMVVALLPAGACFLCRGTTVTSKPAGPLVSVSPTLPLLITHVWRGHTGSIAFLLMFQILSHSMLLAFLLAPWLRMNSLRASTCMPRRMMPCTVGKRGSRQLGTRPVSTNHCSLRFDSTVFTRFSREYSQMCTLRTPITFCTHWNCASRSAYSLVRSACVTPSIAST
mmetsp:Transcript_38935/g.65463  ORF Transcript_38935/g.65463 Transcript_38935/m.65463 type:complete len:279 (+) Transcript_38935:585-1421(+)